jgi:hypothetical protein
MQEIFADVHDKKRLAPEQIIPARVPTWSTAARPWGNSGSVVLDMATGQALVVFAGRFLEANFAVFAAVLGERLDLPGMKTRSIRTNATGAPAGS